MLGMGAREDFFSFGRLYQLNHTDVSRDKFSVEEYTECLAKTPQHQTAKHLKRILPEDAWNSFFKFTVVRNPFSRIVSEYNHLVDSKVHPNIVTFSDLIDFLHGDKFRRIHRLDGHLETQTSFLINEDGIIDPSIKIYRYEEIQTCFSDISKLGPIDSNVISRKGSRTVPYQDFYTPEIEDTVKTFYADDFKNFNYSTNLHE